MTHRVRILALLTDAFGSFGGISKYNRDLLTALAYAEGVEDIVVMPRLGRAVNIELPPRVQQLRPLFNPIRYSLAALRTAATERPFNLVFCGHILHAPLAALIARVLNAKLWLQVHGIDCWNFPGRMLRWAVEQSDLVTAVSRCTRRKLLNWAKIPAERVRVLPNTVSEEFSPGLKSESILEKYGFRNKRVLLTVSRISTDDQYKGHHIVIQAIPQLLKEFPDLIYAIVGDGNGRQRLERLSKEHGVSHQVVFLGRVADQILPDLYRSADVFVMPSTGEGFGIVFLEAMRSGITVIGGNADGSMDPLRDGAAGYVVSCDDPRELTIAIRSALKNPRDNSHHAKVFSTLSFSRHCTLLLEQLLSQGQSRCRRAPSC